jgi:muramidase (phage lysozyme)
VLFSSRAAIALTGLSLSLGAAPSLAADLSNGWAAFAPVPATDGRQADQVSILPPLPTAPRVFAITPERRALLNTIRYAEGTWKNGDTIGYRVMFGGGLTSSLDRHPNRVNYSSGYASAAAGAYQFMPFTWSMISQALGMSDFQPDAQDQGALFLIQRRGALPLVDRGVMTLELAARLAPEWASFPTRAGSSYYGQPVKRLAELQRFYQDNLSQLRQGDVQTWESVPIHQLPRCNDNSLACRLGSVQPVSNSAAVPLTQPTETAIITN